MPATTWRVTLHNISLAPSASSPFCDFLIASSTAALRTSVVFVDAAWYAPAIRAGWKGSSGAWVSGETMVNRVWSDSTSILAFCASHITFALTKRVVPKFPSRWRSISNPSPSRNMGCTARMFSMEYFSNELLCVSIVSAANLAADITRGSLTETSFAEPKPPSIVETCSLFSERGLRSSPLAIITLASSVTASTRRSMELRRTIFWVPLHEENGPSTTV
mmetsp:Transcript_25577/g.55585  ORF Transcript_25577/g.55585 Transcript_25577/m.55585 type:complete len:220 (+) Transcript_25577:321-980(+)